MTPASDAHNCERADLHRDRRPVTAVTGPAALTSGNTNHSTGPEMTEATTPWPCWRARSGEHRYQTCDDEWCDRFPCRVYREGYEAGLRRRGRRGLRGGPR